MQRPCLPVCGLLLLAGLGVAQAGAFEVTLTVDVPAGTELKAEDVKLSPLPAGKKLAAVLYADWGYHTAKSALPAAQAFHDNGWRGTFFFAGAPDLKQNAPQLEALGQEVATNLFSGGIQAYRDEMFSYSTQDILNAIGPLRSELNAVLQRPVIYQLVRGHGVPYRDRIRAMGMVAATHWYQHHIFHGRDSSEETGLGGYQGRRLPVSIEGGLKDEVFEKALAGKQLAVILGREGFARGNYTEFLKAHGGKKEYWYTTLGELASSVYVREKAKVSAVSVEGGKARVTLAMADDFNPIFLRAPISLDVAGKVASVPAEVLTGGPLEVKLAVTPSRISLPGRAALKVSLRNRGQEQISLGPLDCRGPADFDVIINSPGDVPPLAAGMARDVEFQVAMNDKAGPHSFGFVPFVGRVAYEVGGEKRTALAAAELEVRPALSVDVYPCDGVPIGPKASWTFMITVDNLRAGPARGLWKNLRPKFEKFILPPEGEVKGAITFPASDAFKVEPEEIELSLAAEGERKVFHVTVTNTAAAKAPYVLRPEIRLAGEEAALLLPFGGTKVYHVARLGAPPLDDRGMLMYASWDNDKVDLPHADKARGRKEAYRGAMGHITYADGVLGRAASHKCTCLLDPWLNFNETEGTMMFWLRNDPAQRKPLGPNMSERLFAVGTQHPARNVDTGQLSLHLQGRGFLTAKMMTLGPTYHELTAPFKKSDQWQHVALTWSCPKKFVQIIVDGRLVKELKDDGQTWHPVPCRRWPESYGDFFVPISDDHGAYVSTMRDEFYLYNRPLSVEEIREYIKDVKAKAAGQKQERVS
ncbi:MAG: hypothetical protein AMJ81_08980 [Phycisphaerae bacterium SM23_33]|nr:MAG: hypothetical protein AMJ81_08980 [Phycisphaerae bacterium SM23_33]